MDFLEEGNVAGQTLLRIVSRGNAIIAELLRLSDHVPSVFYLSDLEEQKKYGDILFDFRYLQSSDLYDNKIEGSEMLVDLDEEFRENHLVIIERFYLVFESIYKYVRDLLKYLEDVEEGVYIQHTVEDIIMSTDGKQLMTEAFYLYGVMLTLLDRRIDGIARERILICYYRYKGSSDIFSEVCKVCRATGYSHGSLKKPVNYPEEFFGRIPLPKEVLNMLVGRLRSDDIYNQTQSFPAPEHRSAALANQASMLYVILYFLPEILHKEQATMREIVDKHFNDNWIISFYMGYYIDLFVEWEGYKAAKSALTNTVNPTNVKALAVRSFENLQKCQKDIDHYLTEGVLTDNFMLDNIPRLLNTLRSSNCTIRWMMMHLTCKAKKVNEVIQMHIRRDDVLKLLLSTAQFEYKLKQMFERLFESKSSRWEDCRNQAAERMKELSEFFSGEKPLTRVSRDVQLQDWFGTLATEIEALDAEESNVAGRKLSQLMQALEDVEQFHQVETSIQVKAFLKDTRELLHEMLRNVNLKDDVLVTMGVVTDLSYAWQIINDYTPLMHAMIRTDPFVVLLLRATFLKLASILDLPLVRILEAESKDLESVAEYYSGELVAYVRKVLEVIPVNMFMLLREIVALQTGRLKEVPTRAEKVQLKDFAQLDERYTLAQITHKISVFTEGILAMETTLVGVIQVKPEKLLEDGIRKELVRQISVIMNDCLIFRTGKIAEFEQRLDHLASQLQGFRRSFEYISDYVNIYGLKVWQEEFGRIINFNVEQECNSFLKRKIYDWQSQYQSKAIPLPVFPPSDSSSVNFVGRLVRELLHQTDSRKTVYIDALSGWFDKATGREVVGIRTLSLLQRASLTVRQWKGVDRTLAFMTVSNVHKFVKLYRRDVEKSLADVCSSLSEELTPTSTLPSNAKKLYSSSVSKASKLWPFVSDLVMKIGQAQLFRRQISNELNFSAKLDSNLLSCALDVFNKSLMNDIRGHYREPEKKPYPDDENPLLFELGKFLDTCGFDQPQSKIYTTTEPLENVPLVMFLFVIAHIGKFTYEKAIGSLMCKSKSEAFDGVPFVVGVLTILKQFHSSHTQTFIAYLAQFVRANIAEGEKAGKLSDLSGEIRNVLHFLEEFWKYGHFSRKSLEEHVPAYIMDMFHC